jgi:hypothetical protein
MGIFCIFVFIVMRDLIKKIINEMIISETLYNEKIYKYFDENGIEFSNMTIFGKIDSTNFKFKETDERFIKIHTPFNLSDDETNDIVLNYIKDTTGVVIPSVNDLPKYKVLNGKPFLIELQPGSNNIHRRFILPWQDLKGDVFFRGDKGVDYDELPKTKTIHGDLSIYDSGVKSLGGIEKITGDFIFSASKESQLKNKSKLNTLTPLKYVQGNVVIRSNSITTLGTLQHVGGNLSLRFSQVKDLGQLKFVGGNLLISKYNVQFMDTSKIKVGGKIRIYNDPEISPYI